MPIVSISKIQHRYGLSDNGPSDSDTLQLSTAELGWEIDTRKLFIGNGPVSEGAPAIGNTEVLTQYSDILGISSGYQYKGAGAGYTALTGADASNPTVRTLQRKLDDFASVKDFGAVGDGVTDDTVAINRAFSELFARESNTEVRRSLFFPAGVYIVTDTVKIPSYAKVYGDGKRSSIIRQTTVTPGVALADSKQQISPNIGNNGATIPSFIEVNDISFENTQAGTVLEIASSQNCVFRRTGLVGSLSTAPSTVGTGETTVLISSTAVNQTKNIVFEQCDISNNVFGVVADNDMQGILFNGCYFHTLFKGAKLGENTSGTGASVDGPKGVKITNGFFDSIYNTGIHVYNISGVVSAYNYFADVGNSLNGTGNPAADTVIFAGDGNASINDIFDRTDADDATNPRVDVGDKSVYVVNSADGVYYGYHKAESGKAVTLNDNTSSAASSTITFSATTEKTNLVYYTASRGSNVRHGVMRVTASASGSTLTDEYNEDGTDIGLEFSTTVASGTTTLNYTTTSTGDDITFKYRIERLT